jgi:hypothetical protein
MQQQQKQEEAIKWQCDGQKEMAVKNTEVTTN